MFPCRAASRGRVIPTTSLLRAMVGYVPWAMSYGLYGFTALQLRASITIRCPNTHREQSVGVRWSEGLRRKDRERVAADECPRWAGDR
jgi:hypothetical protein